MIYLLKKAVEIYLYNLNYKSARIGVSNSNVANFTTSRRRNSPRDSFFWSIFWFFYSGLEPTKQQNLKNFWNSVHTIKKRHICVIYSDGQNMGTLYDFHLLNF